MGSGRVNIANGKFKPNINLCGNCLNWSIQLDLPEIVGEPATKLMHPKYTNAKYVFLYIIIYEKHDFHGSQAKLATYSCLFNINVEKHRKFGPVTPKI